MAMILLSHIKAVCLKVLGFPPHLSYLHELESFFQSQGNQRLSFGTLHPFKGQRLFPRFVLNNPSRW